MIDERYNTLQKIFAAFIITDIIVGAITMAIVFKKDKGRGV